MAILNHLFSLALGFMLLFSLSKEVYANSNNLLKEVEFLSINNLNQLKKTEINITELTHLPSVTKEEQLQLIRLVYRRQELLLRNDFIRRLALQIDSHYQGQQKNEFLTSQMSKMAEIEAKSSNPKEHLIKFIMNCRQVLIDRPRSQANAVELIERYMKSTHISKNKTSATFYKESDYSNRSESYTARDLSFEEVGVKYEQLQNLKINKTKSSPKPINIHPAKSDQDLINKKVFLQDRLNNSTINTRSLKKRLANPKVLSPRQLKQFMNLEELQNK